MRNFFIVAIAILATATVAEAQGFGWHVEIDGRLTPLGQVMANNIAIVTPRPVYDGGWQQFGQYRRSSAVGQIATTAIVGGLQIWEMERMRRSIERQTRGAIITAAQQGGGQTPPVASQPPQQNSYQQEQSLYSCGEPSSLHGTIWNSSAMEGRLVILCPDGHREYPNPAIIVAARGSVEILVPTDHRIGFEIQVAESAIQEGSKTGHFKLWKLYPIAGDSGLVYAERTNVSPERRQ